MKLRTTQLVPDDLDSHVYSTDWGWRIDLLPRGVPKVVLPNPEDGVLVGAVGLETVEAGDLTPRQRAMLDDCDRLWQTHVWLSESRKGSGLGVLLYSMAFEFALKKKHCVISTDDPSDSARRVWSSRRLREVFRIDKIGNRYIMTGTN